jgi:hypothetical protein
MLDPAALGTLRIGLDAIEAEARLDRLPKSVVPSRGARSGVRVALAGVLRRVADALEPRPVGRELC